VKTDVQVEVKEPTQQVGNVENTGAKTHAVSLTATQENTAVNIVGTIEGTRFGIIKSKYGSSLQGNKIRYIPKLYLGRLSYGDKIELADANVIEGEFGIPMVKVGTFEETSTAPAKSIGWVALADTNFVDSFVADPMWLNKPDKLIDPEKMREIESFARAYEKATQKTGAGVADVAVEDFDIQPYPEGGLYSVFASIRNKGESTSPKFRVYFYKNDPERKKPMNHGAGPIKPGDVWNEGSMPFALQEGTNEIAVVLDPDNTIGESDRTNNEASIKVVVKDGKIIDKKVSL
jgi:hypothetical protein